MDSCNCELASAGTRFRDGQLTDMANNPSALHTAIRREPKGDVRDRLYSAEFRYPARSWSLHAGQSLSEPTAADATTKLAPGAGLIVALFLSVGLWGGIWQAVSSLTAWFR
jgi:hypothetical protein